MFTFSGKGSWGKSHNLNWNPQDWEFLLKVKHFPAYISQQVQVEEFRKLLGESDFDMHHIWQYIMDDNVTTSFDDMQKIYK